MKQDKVARTILTWLAGFLTVGGLFIAVANETPLFGIVNGLIDPLFWRAELISPGTARFKSFAWSYVGMLMALWGIFLYFVARFALAKGERWAWTCIAVSTLVWFCLDTWFSVSAGLFVNVAVNLLILLAIAVPLGITRGGVWRAELTDHRPAGPTPAC
jgi:hypothetical protein